MQPSTWTMRLRERRLYTGLTGRDVDPEQW
jgi:hypothetical protein